MAFRKPSQFYEIKQIIFFVNKNNFFERRTVDYMSAYNENNRGDWEFNILAEY